MLPSPPLSTAPHGFDFIATVTPQDGALDTAVIALTDELKKHIE
jgi:hypothetical protein